MGFRRFIQRGVVVLLGAVPLFSFATENHANRASGRPQPQQRGPAPLTQAQELTDLKDLQLLTDSLLKFEGVGGYAPTTMPQLGTGERTAQPPRGLVRP